MRQGHHAAAPAFVLGLAVAADWTARASASYGHPLWHATQPLQVVIAAALAVPFSAGRLSPDADQTWLSHLGHRRGAHWWGWPVLTILAVELVWRATVGGHAPLALHGPALGVLSHLAADFWFGKGGRSIPRGIPLTPFRHSPRIGMGVRVSAKRSGLERALIGSRRRHSILEWVATCALIPATGALGWVYLSQAGIIA